jgi:hypothetical protein
MIAALGDETERVAVAEKPARPPPGHQIARLVEPFADRVGGFLRL